LLYIFKDFKVFAKFNQNRKTRPGIMAKQAKRPSNDFLNAEKLTKL
jgi:hypothetical protein